MLSKRSRMVLLAGLVVLGLVPAPGALGASITRHRIDDGFSGSSIAQNVWVATNPDPANATIVEGGGVLSMSVGAGAAPNDFVVVNTRCSAQGDFDERIGFSLPVWPLLDNASLAMDAMPGYGMGRGSGLEGDSYWSFLNPQFAEVPTSDLSGRVRIVRRGATLTSYFYAGGRWVMLGYNPSVPTGDAQMNLHLSLGSDFGGQPVQIAFKYFHVYADAIIC